MSAAPDLACVACETKVDLIRELQGEVAELRHALDEVVACNECRECRRCAQSALGGVNRADFMPELPTGDHRFRTKPTGQT